LDLEDIAQGLVIAEDIGEEGRGAGSACKTGKVLTDSAIAGGRGAGWVVYGASVINVQYDFSTYVYELDQVEIL
jgi:hypothetical protein